MPSPPLRERTNVIPQLPVEVLSRITELADLETAKSLALTSKCLLSTARTRIWGTLKLTTGYIGKAYEDGDGYHANPILALLNSETPLLKKEIRRLIISIDRIDHNYTGDTQRTEGMLRLLRDISGDLQHLAIQYTGNIRAWSDHEAPDELDLPNDYRSAAVFAKQIYMGRKTGTADDPVTLPKLRTLSLDVVDYSRDFMPDPLSMLALSPNIEVLDMFDSQYDNEDVVPAREWQWEHTVIRARPIPTLQQLRIIVLSHFDIRAHQRDTVENMLTRILQAAPTAEALIVSCYTNRRMEDAAALASASGSLKDLVWRTTGVEAQPQPLFTKMQRLAYSCEQTEDVELEILDQLPVLEKTEVACALTTARPSRSALARQSTCGTWSPTFPLHVTRILQCPRLTMVHFADADEYFSDPIGPSGALCRHFESQYSCFCRMPTESDTAIDSTFLDNANTLMDRLLPPSSTWEAIGSCGFVIRSYSTLEPPPSDIANALFTFTNETFTHVRFLSRAIPKGVARSADIQYAQCSVGRTQHEGIQDRRMWIDMTDYCGHWVPRNVIDQLYAAADEPDGAAWLEGRRGGDLGAGWDVLRDWVRLTTKQERDWRPDTSQSEDRGEKKKKKEKTPDMRFFQQTIHGNYPGYCKRHGYMAMKKQNGWWP